MFRGRKVKDPVVHAATTAPSSKDSHQGLAKAWTTVEKAKSELRKIEHRLENVERRAPSQLNETGETSITDYGALGGAVGTDRINQTYDTRDHYKSGAVVDNYGRSAYLRSKTAGGSTTTRKVSRLEDKYVDKVDNEDKKLASSKSRETRSADRGPKTHKPPDFNLRERNYDMSSDRHTSRSVGEKRVDFAELPKGRENHMDSANQHGAHRAYSPILENSSITDSRDIRETGINFLNNDLTARDTDVRWDLASGPKLSHVSVTVPGSSKTLSSNKYTGGEPPTTSANRKQQAFLELISSENHAGEREYDRQDDLERRSNASDCSQSDSESTRARKFRGDIRNIDPDGLAKLKETIRKQIKTPKENSDDRQLGAEGGGIAGDHMASSRHHIHNANDPILPRSQEYTVGAEKHPKVRKIAAGPALPCYKGFSEAEVKYRVVDKVPKASQEARRREKKRQVSLRVRDQRFEAIGNWLAVEDDKAGDKKKVTRVIAPSRKPSKKEPQQKKEIITTSSWRAGQELILRELGPAKSRKSSSKSRDVPDPHDSEDSHGEDGEEPMEDRPEALGGEEYPDNLGIGSATMAEIECSKALSEEAKRVYNDLQLDSDDGKKRSDSEERAKKWKAPVKRKAPKNSEQEKQPSASKQRHYNPDEVRRYMQKQKAERIRRQRDEEDRHKEMEEARRKHLEELYEKQKPPAPTSKKNKENKAPQRLSQDTFTRSKLLEDLPHHHPFHKERPNKFMTSSDSDRNISHADPEDVSDGSSTITGDGSMDEGTPTHTPRMPKVDLEMDGNRPKHRSLGNNMDVKFDKKLKSHGGEATSSNMKSIGGITFDKDGVMSKFSQALQEKLNEEPRGILNSGSGGYHSLPPEAAPPVISGVNMNSDSAGVGLTRADRIQAIKETAATLQSRIQAEARKIQSQNPVPSRNNEHGATTSTRPAGVRWNDQDDKQEFRSRYERVTAATDDFTVFRNNLPGNQGNLRLPDDTATASGTTATSRYTSQNLPASRRDRGDDNQDIGEESTITETSTFSEITETDESDNELGPSQKKIGSGLKGSDFHSGRSTLEKPKDLSIPRPGHTQAKKTSRDWNEPDVDPYNVFSIYSRKQQEKFSKSSGSNKEPTKSTPALEETQRRTEHVTTQASVAPPSKVTSGQRSQSPAMAARSESPYGASGYTSVSSRSDPVRAYSPAGDKSRSRQQTTVSFKPVPKSTASDEDTLEEESYTESFETEEEKKSRSKSVTDKQLPPSRGTSQPGGVPEEEEVGTDTEMSALESIHGRQSPLPGHSSEPKGPPRLSPNSLERRFFAELNQLDSMETSMRQLTSVERTRAVAMSQQETVSLAQMLKGRQQAHDLQMKDLQLKAQHEAVEATKQLEDARKRASDAAINAADMIAKVRGDGITGIQESTRKLIDTQTEAAKATAEAAKFLAEARAYGMQDTNRFAVETAAAAAASAVNTALENKWNKPSTRGKGPAPVPAHRGSGDSDLSLSVDFHDESGMSQGSADELSVDFDESMTNILPSESHRRKVKHIHSDNESIISEASEIHELNSLFAGEESFDKFTDEIVKQFMKKEEIRAKHQAQLLKLREKALVEKTKAEYSWLEQQKQRMRNKGADDNYPQLVKRQRGLKLKLQEQQAEIRRLREENKAASKERHRKLQEEIAKKRQQQTKQEKVSGRLGRPNEVHTEAEVSSIDEASDAEKKTRKDYKSDSEIYTEVRGGKKSKGDKVERYKKIHLDEKFLTQRQHRLMDRRKNAEELLKWKQLLDEEENRIFKLEKKAIKVWDKKDETETKISTRRDTRESVKDTTATQDTTYISEAISTAKDDSMYTRSNKDSSRTQTVSTESSPEEIHRRRLNDKSNLKNHERSGSESSINDIASQSSIEEAITGTKNDTLTNGYGNDTFEDTVTKDKTRSAQSPRSPLDQLKKMKPLQSPRNFRSPGRNSGSDTDESFSHTETDLSDFEGRIRALKDDLRRRKTEADRLKRERKKKKRELMKDKEETLKKQIEAYDSQICVLKVELQKELEHEPVKGGVRPQIKQPKVSPPKALKKPDTSTTTKQKTFASPESVKTAESSDKKAAPRSATVSLDKISEVGESLSSRSDWTDSTQREKLLSLKELKPDEESVTDEKTEEISEAIENISEVSDDKSFPGINLQLGPTKEDMYDVSVSIYTDDFTAEPGTASHVQTEKAPLSARSQGSVYTEDFTAEAVTASHPGEEKMRHSARSQVTDSDLKNPPLSARSLQDHESDIISEHIPDDLSISLSQAQGSLSEPLLKFDLDTKKGEEPVIIDDQSEGPDIDNNEPSVSTPTPKSDSRPSSGTSERDMISSSENDETSDSERSGLMNKPSLSTEKSIKEEISQASSVGQSRKGLISNAVFDIDDLLGGPMDDEDLTPVASPMSTVKENQFFVDALSDFQIGDRVSVTGPSGGRTIGTLLFKGIVKFAPGVWAGVELDKPNGRNDGSDNGERYFTCRPDHGIFVPGNDLMPAPDEPETGQLIDFDVHSSIDSQTSSKDGESDHESVTDFDLNKLISEADENVRLFGENASLLPSPGPSPKPSPRDATRNKKNNKLAERITDDLFESVIRENFSKISDIAAAKHGRRSGPPPAVAPKPKKETPKTNGILSPEEEEALNDDSFEKEEKHLQTEKGAGNVVTNLMNDAIDHMLTIHSNKQQTVTTTTTTSVDTHRDSGSYHDDVIDDVEQVVSPTEELRRIENKEEVDEKEKVMDAPPRPGSPVPGPLHNKEDVKQLEDSGNFEFDEEPWPPNKAPPPYPGVEYQVTERSEISRTELQKLTEELFFAVPHKAEEVGKIVGSAVDSFWTQRRYGESLENVKPPDSYFNEEEQGGDLISNSKRVFKRLLFDLTGEVIRNIYKEEEYDSPLPWHKPKRKQNKYYRGTAAPTTVDVLKPVVQEAIVDILGLNGARKSERGKWGIRKKKDLVDNILVQELREEEPQWVNYDDDELAVKMQLTETIFESLLTDTVQTMNKIFRKRQSLSGQN